MKKWLINTLLTIVTSLFIIAIFNYIMDPMWTFEHQHPYNQYQRGSKERQQKSHTIYFGSHKYNTLLLGSSRTTYMDQALWLEKGDLFNYAVSDMQPKEYLSYINFAINEAKQPIKHIVLGLDFFGALEYAPLISTQQTAILSPISQSFYRWKLLFSFSALDYSIKNVKYYLKKRPNTYDRNNRKYFDTIKARSPEQYKKTIEGGLEDYRELRYSTSYDNNFKFALLELKQKYPDIEFLVYTTPVNLEHFNLLIETDQYENYERWLKESTEVFGTVHHFMYLNQFTKNSEDYFIDSNHPQEETTKCIAQQVQGRRTTCHKTDFILKEKQIDQQLKELREINFPTDPS